LDVITMFKNNPLDINTSSEQVSQSEKDWGVEIKNVEVKKINRLNVPVFFQAGECSFEDIKTHALIRQRLRESTVKKNLRYLRFMELHECPVDFRNLSYENFIRHMDYREQIEGAGADALRHEWKAMRMYLRAVGINPVEWQYRPPPRAKYTAKKIPTPDQVCKIFKMRYHPDNVRNACIKYPVMHSFLIGWRVPSEPIIAKTTDINLEEKTMKITSPKLHNSTRYIDITEIIKPITDWLEKWRPKVENQYSQDALYLHFDGRPFGTKEQLRRFFYDYAYPKIKHIFPGYYNYLTRHWNAIAKLIKTKVETNHYDVYEVKEWLGHTKIETTMNYVQQAKLYYKKHPYDWIKRALKYYNNDEIIGESTLKSEKVGDFSHPQPEGVSQDTQWAWRNPYVHLSLKNSPFFLYKNQSMITFITFYINQAFLDVSGRCGKQNSGVRTLLVLFLKAPLYGSSPSSFQSNNGREKKRCKKKLSSPAFLISFPSPLQTPPLFTCEENPYRVTPWEGDNRVANLCFTSLFAPECFKFFSYFVVTFPTTPLQEVVV